MLGEARLPLADLLLLLNDVLLEGPPLALDIEELVPLGLDLGLRQRELPLQLPHLLWIDLGGPAQRNDLQIHLLEIGQGLQSFLQS